MALPFLFLSFEFITSVIIKMCFLAISCPPPLLSTSAKNICHSPRTLDGWSCALFHSLQICLRWQLLEVKAHKATAVTLAWESIQAFRKQRNLPYVHGRRKEQGLRTLPWQHLTSLLLFWGLWSPQRICPQALREAPEVSVQQQC